MAALKYWVWLATLPGLGTRTHLQLLEHFDSRRTSTTPTRASCC